MGVVPDINGEFEVPDLPEAPSGGTWTISKRLTTPEYPDKWWDYGIDQLPWMMVLNTSEGTWECPIYDTSDKSIKLSAESCLLFRFEELRGEWITANGPAHPVPQA